MDWDNIGPIAIFIIYMAISAWSKQNKARRRNQPVEKPKQPETDPVAKPVQAVGGILEQLKKELFEIDEEPLVFQREAPVPEPEIEVMEEPQIEPEVVPVFREGSQRTVEVPHPHVAGKLDEGIAEGQTLEEVLEPYSKLEQGIILHEILGRPRARQENDEWFHRS